MVDASMFKKLTIIYLGSLVLLGCGSNNSADLVGYVRDVQARKPSTIEPLPPTVQYATYHYDESDLRDPFVLEDTGTTTNTSPCPEMARSRDALEDFPLDTLTMVGSLEHEQLRWALIRTQNGAVHRIKADDYLGQHSGRILKITETEVQIREFVPAADSGCIKRVAVLSLSK